MSNKVLVVLTNFSKYPTMNRATGLWLSEATHFVEKVESAGYTVDYVSPKGGYTPIDPASLEAADETDWAFYQNESFMRKLGNTLKPSEVNAADYQAIYYAGGHGTVWDFPENEELQKIGQTIYENGGIVSAVCHGVVGLLNIKIDETNYLIDGKTVTGFSNEEETLAQLDQHVPYLTETELVNRGVKYEKASEPFAPFAVEDGRLITGQNPASSAAVAELVLKQLEK